MSKGNTETSSNTEAKPRWSGSIGDPDCPICHGVGFVRRDLPIGDPEFGRLEICSCRLRDVARSEAQRLYRLSNLDAFRNMTFDTFKVQGRLGLGEAQIKSLNYAFNQAQYFAKNLQGWILFTGDYGCGKTHLAAAIANFTVGVGVPTLFLTVPDLLDWLRFSFSSSDFGLEERLEEIRSIRLLVLDDLGTQNTTPWASEKLYQIINHRYINRLPTVLTTNLTLKEIDGRISSRLRDPDLVSLVDISAPDFRTPMDDEGFSHISSLMLLTDRTFGSFSLRDNEKLSRDDMQTLKKSFDATNQFSQEPSGWIVLAGPHGSGKTHLAAAIGNYRRSIGDEAIFVVVLDLLDYLRDAFNPNSNISYKRRFEEVRTAPLLILDDLGTQSSTPWASDKLFQILNYRYNAQLPTVITTSQEVKDIEPRIRSRILDRRLCTVYGITAPAYRPAGTAQTRRRSSKQSN